MTTWNGPWQRDLTDLVRGAIVLNDPEPDPDTDTDRRVLVELGGYAWDRFTILARHIDGAEPRTG